MLYDNNNKNKGNILLLLTQWETSVQKQTLEKNNEKAVNFFSHNKKLYKFWNTTFLCILNLEDNLFLVSLQFVL